MARARGAAALATATSTGGQSTATQRMRFTTNGPHDIEALDAQFVPVPGTVDFGAVRVPIPADGSVVVEPSAAGGMQAVHVSVPEGRLSVSALASPRNGGLWPDLATEIDASLREGGARVRSFTGEWGRELHATTNGATSVFVGVDGPRWMLYGVATGPTRDAVALDARLRRMLRGTVVVRGKAPYPVRTVLPLTATSQLDGEAQGVALAAPTMTLRVPTSDGAAPNGAVANGAVANGAAASGAVANWPASNGSAVNGAAANGAVASWPASNGAAANGAPANGAVASWPASNGAPANGAAANGAVANWPASNGAAVNGSPPGGGIPPGVPGAGAAAYGAPYPPAASSGAWVRGAGPHGAAPTGAPALGTGSYNVEYNAETNGANGHLPATNGAAPGAGAVPDTRATSGGYPTGYPTGVAASGMPSTGGPLNGWSPTGAPPSGPHGVGESAPPWGGSNAAPYGATPPTGSTNGLSAYGAPPRGASYDGPSLGAATAPYGAAFDQAPAGGAVTNGQALAPGPTATGGTPRRGVPAGWAHDTGTNRRGSSAAGLSSAPYSEPPPPTAIPALRGPSERPWEPSAPVAPLPSWAAAQPADPTTQPAPPQHAPTPVEPTHERRSSWADPDDARGAEPAAAFSPTHWDPLSDPLPGGFDPLPEPVPTWSDAVYEPSERWRAEAVRVDPLPGAGTPLFDAASAFSSRAVEQPDAGTPLYDAASSSDRLRSTPPDVGTPLFDATSVPGTSHRSADPAERVAASDVGTPLFDAASAREPRATERNGHRTGTSRLGDVTSEPGRRSRRDPDEPWQAVGTSRPDVPRRTRRHREPGDEQAGSVAPPAGRPSHEAPADRRAGRRRAEETPTTSPGRHEAGPTSVRYRDAPTRHADPENRHAAPPGSSPRVPPTQWAWPKEEPPSVGSPYEVPSGRRAADTGSTWSAAELLDARHDGGRRRRGDAARHGQPDDPEPGRHSHPGHRY